MKLNLKKKSLFPIVLFFCCNMYTIDLLDNYLLLTTHLDTSPLNFTIETAYETFISSTITYEDHITLVHDRYNHETGQHFRDQTDLSFDSLRELNSPSNSFDCQLPSHFDVPQAYGYDSHQSSNSDHFNDHLKDSAVDQRRQDLGDNHTSSLQEQNNKQQAIQQKRRTLTLDNVCTENEYNAAISSPNIRSHLQQLIYSFTYQFEEKAKTCSRQKTLAELQAKPNFIKAMLSGRIAHLLEQTRHPDLAIAEIAFNELKQLWPWKRQDSFLQDNSHSLKELKFLSKLGINIMKVAERNLITRPDYIAKYADEQLRKTIQNHREKCLLLQQQGNRAELCKQVEQLHESVNKNRKKERFVNNTSFAITMNVLFDPLTTALYNIAHAPSLEKARNELQYLEVQIKDQAQQKNVFLTSEIKEWTIEQYGFDVRQAAHECYTTRIDYVHTPENKTAFSDPVSSILSNIQHKNLHMAYKELVNAEKQITECLESLNITDPVAQKDHLIENFGIDIRQAMQTTYKERPDFLNLIKLFTPLDVQYATATILSENNDYQSVALEFDKVAEQVLDNAKLCSLDFIPEVEDQIYQSLQVMRTPRNEVEFVFNATVVDHLLTDLQHHVENIVEGKPTLIERAPELFTRAVVKFVTRLNPITQAQDIGSLLYHGGNLIGKGLHSTVNAALHPISTAQDAMILTNLACDFVIKSARFSCDTVSGLYYLSPEERSQQIETAWNSTCKIYRQIESQTTAEQVIDIVAPAIADFAFFWGAPKVGTFLVEIDALGKITNEAKIIAQGLKNAVEEHPAYVTAEGIVLKISNGMKNSGGGPKQIIHTAKELFDSTYLPIAHQLGEEIKHLKKTFERFDTFKGKPIQLDFDHVFTLNDLIWKNGKASKLGGFHHDFMGTLQDSGTIHIIEKIVSKKNGYYLADVIVDGVSFKNKTFFPKHWPREKVASIIHETYKDFKNSGGQAILESNGKYKIEVLVEEGVKIRMFITEKGIIKSAYPIFENLKTKDTL